ncbi:hypothetical protein [Crenobacter caeni]|uniref:Uncharacterized protein n=1 Tax=Crenobacter caeni TaxID=2705474 RepID=A0A6B2KTH1_9NEIS|nr:hypothetical protein [Crenobacter caeni]NDV13546.1 hypothetical protein [Crenobacter caeni]
MKLKERIARLEQMVGTLEPRCIAVLVVDASLAAADFIEIGLTWQQDGQAYRTALLPGETLDEACGRVAESLPPAVHFLTAAYEHQRGLSPWQDAEDWA